MKPNGVMKCYRCRTRCRNNNIKLWNVEYVAGLELGMVCPQCQSNEENLGAEVNLALGTTQGIRQSRVENATDLTAYIYQLLDAYPTPEIMRNKANKIAAVRTDTQAAEVTRLMRRLADEMESGELYDDE
jgi:hypothetical protein